MLYHVCVCVSYWFDTCTRLQVSSLFDDFLQTSSQSYVKTPILVIKKFPRNIPHTNEPNLNFWFVVNPSELWSKQKSKEKNY